MFTVLQENATKFDSKNEILHIFLYQQVTSYGYIIMDLCIISFNLNCTMHLKQFYNIATTTFCDLPDCSRFVKWLPCRRYFLNGSHYILTQIISPTVAIIWINYVFVYWRTYASHRPDELYLQSTKGTECNSLILYISPHHASDHTAYKID